MDDRTAFLQQPHQRTGPLLGLAYVGLPAEDLTGWTDYATRLLGMQAGPSGPGQVGFRMDENLQRLFAGTLDGPVAGWQVAGRADLDTVANRLDQAGIATHELSAELLERRCVGQGLHFQDPDGNRVEVVADLVTGDPFVPGRAIRGFRTGDLGMGHFVLTSPNAPRLCEFYASVLGFGLSDWCGEPFEGYFFHLNARHHSLAVIQHQNVGVHHLMVEVNGWDDVGQGYDLALVEQDRVAVTLGRHSNDHMTSFYSRTPSGPLIEYGWGGLSLDPAAWDPCELEIGPSFWGHERSWLPPEIRDRARRMRMDAAADGVHAPVHVHGTNYDTVR